MMIKNEKRFITEEFIIGDLEFDGVPRRAGLDPL